MQAPGNPVVWFELYVTDLARAKTFYKAVFQVELTDMVMPPGSENLQMSTFPWVEKGPGATGALVKSPHMGPGGGGTLVYFSCADCAVEAARAEASGGKVCQPKMSIGPYGFIAIVQDSEGNTIGLHSM